MQSPFFANRYYFTRIKLYKKVQWTFTDNSNAALRRTRFCRFVSIEESKIHQLKWSRLAEYIFDFLPGLKDST